MAIDLVKAYVDAKDKYRMARGGSPASGKWSPPSNVVPKTTVVDVELATQKFQELYDAAYKQFPTTLNRDTIGRTVAAYDKWRASTPSGKYFFGLGKPGAAEIYPHNDEFWGTAGQMLLQASAAGVVPGQWSLAVESVEEAIRDLPKNLWNWGPGKILVGAVVGYIAYDAFIRRRR